MNNKLIAVGVGPGNPEWLTIEAKKVIEACDVLILPNVSKEKCTAFSIIENAFDLDQKEIFCVDFPMTKDTQMLEQSHQKAIETIQTQLNLGKEVVFLVLGDPTIYSSYFHIHERIEELGFSTQIINGISSITAVAAKLKISLAKQDEQIHILSGNCDITSSFLLKGTLIFMKSGKKLEELKLFLKEKRKEADFEVYGASKCGMEGEVLCTNIDQLDSISGYFTIVIVKNIQKQEKQYRFFQHRDCEMFPCHKIEKEEEFNCLYCYCPFYMLGDACGGNFSYTKSGIKSCMNCNYPHQKKNYDEIQSRLKELLLKKRT